MAKRLGTRLMARVPGFGGGDTVLAALVETGGLAVVMWRREVAVAEAQAEVS